MAKRRACCAESPPHVPLPVPPSLGSTLTRCASPEIRISSIGRPSGAMSSRTCTWHERPTTCGDAQVAVQGLIQ